MLGGLRLLIWTLKVQSRVELDAMVLRTELFRFSGLNCTTLLLSSTTLFLVFLLLLLLLLFILFWLLEFISLRIELLRLLLSFLVDYE